LVRPQDTVDFITAVHRCVRSSQEEASRGNRVTLSTARTFRDGPETDGRVDNLCRFLEHRDITVDIGGRRPFWLTPGTIGCYSPFSGSIWISGGLNDKSRLHTLAHEAAHVLTVDDVHEGVNDLWKPKSVEDVQRIPAIRASVAEIVAETAAFVATSPYLVSESEGSVHYAAVYALDTPHVQQALRLSARTAHKAAQTLHSALNGDFGEQ
jgi:hypothetical protein